MTKVPDVGSFLQVEDSHLQEKTYFSPPRKCTQVGGRWLVHLEVNSIQIPWFNHFTISLTPLWPRWHLSTVEVYGERCAQKMHLYQWRFENIFSLLGLLPLLSLGVCCQMSRNAGKGVSVQWCWDSIEETGTSGWWGFWEELQQKLGVELAGDTYEEQVVENWAKMPPNTQGQLALNSCINTLRGNTSAATE